ncbi:OR13A protein, partial [Acromyrmex heyeri]
YTMDSNYYGVVKKVSSLVGQWPYQNPKTKLICLSVVTLSTFSIVIPQLAKFVICNGDMQCIFQTMAAHMLTIITLVKLYTCHLNRYKIKVLIDRLFLEWDELETPEEYEIMKRYAKNGRRYSLGYSLYCFISAFLFLCMSLIPPLLDIVLPLNESRPILSVHPGYYFVDEKEYFFYIFWHAVVVWEIAVTGIVAHDCMLLTYIEHVCSIFALGGFRFERLMYKCNEYESDTITVLHSHASDTFRKRIAFSVYTHRKALKFAQLIEDTFSITLALQIALNTVMISITLLQVLLYFSYCMEITQHNASVFIVVRYVVYVLSQLIHLFCLSFEGQKLIDHSLQTRDKIYNSLWYKTSPKSQRMLLFVMQKAFHPVFLSACKIYIFSRENFTMIVQTSMSYFTVLASLE